MKPRVEFRALNPRSSGEHPMMDLVCLILLIYVPNIWSNEYNQIRGEGKEIRTYFNSFDCYLLMKFKERREENVGMKENKRRYCWL